MKIICHNCKKSINGKMLFCPNCGAKIDVQDYSEEKVEKEVSMELLIANAMKIPGVKVNRKEFLAKAFANENVELDRVIAVGPVVAGCTDKMLRRISNKLVLTRTSESSIVSFAAGIPGGLAMAATIPADTLQFFGMTLRMAQEITYLYGLEDLWKNDDVDVEKVQSHLVLYCGVMFGVAGAAQGVRLLAAQVAKQVAKQLPKQALTKTVWYPIVKQIGKTIGIKITKDITAKGISKAIPVIGGVVSGGLTFASMKPMGKRLVDTLEEANFGYTREQAEKDMFDMEKLSKECEAEDIIMDDVGLDSDVEVDEYNNPSRFDNFNNDVLTLLEKLADLKDKGILTEEEFTNKKMELLSKL